MYILAILAFNQAKTDPMLVRMNINKVFAIISLIGNTYQQRHVNALGNFNQVILKDFVLAASKLLTKIDGVVAVLFVLFAEDISDWSNTCNTRA